MLNKDKSYPISLRSELISRIQIESAIFSSEEEKQKVIWAWRKFQRESGHKRKLITNRVRSETQNPEVALKNTVNPAILKELHHLTIYEHDIQLYKSAIKPFHFILYNILRGYPTNRGFSPTIRLDHLTNTFCSADTRELRPHYAAESSIFDLSYRLRTIVVRYDILTGNRPETFYITKQHTKEEKIKDLNRRMEIINKPFGHLLSIEQLRIISDELEDKMGQIVASCKSMP